MIGTLVMVAMSTTLTVMLISDAENRRYAASWQLLISSMYALSRQNFGIAAVCICVAAFGMWLEEQRDWPAVGPK